MLFLLTEYRYTKQKVILFSLCLTPKLLEKSDPFKGNLNFVVDLSKPFLKSLLLYAIYLLTCLFLPNKDRMKAFEKVYCFRGGYSKYIQLPIASEDKEKTAFTCPFNTNAFRRMSFGLCNAPATFQRWMMSICFF